MTRILLTLATATLLLAPAAAAAQERPRAGTAGAGQPAPPARPRSDTTDVVGTRARFPGTPGDAPSQSVKVDVTLTHSSGNLQPVTRTVSLLLADGRPGAIRMQHGSRFLNVDATPWVTRTGEIFLELKFAYSHKEAKSGVGAPTDASPASVPIAVPDGISAVSASQDLNVLLKPGVKTTVARTEDGPDTGTITVEVAARPQM